MSGWKIAGALLTVILLAVAAVVVIRIATDNGELIVRAEQDAQVVVRRDGNTVQQLEVSKGDHAITVRSGAYEVELKGGSDELIVSRDTVTVKRGERIVVYVQKRPRDAGGASMMLGTGVEGAMYKKAMMGEMDMYGSDMMSMGGSGGSPSTESKPAPTYDGKTYAQWIAELQTERKPERLADAILAFGSLGDSDQALATESAAAIMQVMRRNGSNVIDDSPQGRLINQAREVLWQMPGDIVVAAIEEELRAGNTRSRLFLTFLLHPAFYPPSGYGSSNVDFDAAVNRRAEPICQLLLALPEEEAAVIRANALSLVVGRAASENIAFTEIEGLAARLHDALQAKDLELVTVATNSLIESDPDHQGLVPALMRLASSTKSTEDRTGYFRRLNAIRSLGRLGARSSSAVETLVKIIRPLGETDSASVEIISRTLRVANGGFGGMGGGGFPSGYGTGEDIFYVTIEALGDIGPAAKEALPLLRKIAAREPAAGNSGASAGAGGGYGGGPGMFGGGEPRYTAVAKAAIAKIEGQPLDHAAEPPELPDGSDLR